MLQTSESDFQSRMQEIDKSIRELESLADPRVRSVSQSLVQALLEVHAGGLRKLLDLVSEAGPAGQHILTGCVDDALLRNLLCLHGLHPVDLETRVQQALAKVRPYLQSHGGDVELLAIAPAAAAVRLRLQGSCHGCAASQETLKSKIEEAICEFAPDVEVIEVEGLTPRSPDVPLRVMSLPILGQR